MRKSVFFLILFWLPLCAEEALIFESGDIGEIVPYIDEKSLLLLDLDNTVICSATSLGSAAWFYDQLDRRMKEGSSRDEGNLWLYPQWVRLQQVVETQLVDDRFPTLISGLQKESRWVLALTARHPIVAIPTLDQLASVGIDFSAHPFGEMEFNARYPTVFYDGVIFCHDLNDKGEILGQFLDRVEGIETVVFVDDIRRNLEKVQKVALEKGLKFVGMRYSAQDEKMKNYNPRISQIQKEFLDAAIPDAAAEKILKSQTGQEALKAYSDPIELCERADLTLKPEEELFLQAQMKGRVIQSYSLADLLPIANENTLVVFDINDTLITTKQKLGSPHWAAELVKNHSALSGQEALNRLVPFWHKVLEASEAVPVEVDTAYVIRKLAQKGVPMIGLTANYVEIAPITLAALKSCSIDFSKGPIAKNDFALDTPYPAKFLSGVLFSGLQNKKSVVLKQFLSRLGLSFDRIVFVDDKRKNVSELSFNLGDLDSDYTGVWYRAVEKKPPQDSDVVKLQTIYFNRIVPDHLIEELIK